MGLLCVLPSLGGLCVLLCLLLSFGSALVGPLWVRSGPALGQLSGSALGVRFGGSHFGSASGLLWVIFVVFAALRVRPLGLLWVCVGSALGLHRVRFTSALFIFWVCFGFTLGLLCGLALGHLFGPASGSL